MRACSRIARVEPLRLVHLNRVLAHVGLGLEAALPYDARFPWAGDRIQKFLVVAHRVEDRVNFVDAKPVEHFFFGHWVFLVEVYSYSLRRISAASWIALSLW